MSNSNQASAKAREVGWLSFITCPACGAVAKERMPADSYQISHQCRSCEAVLRPKPGDRCVFSSYETFPAPGAADDADVCELNQPEV